MNAETSEMAIFIGKENFLAGVSVAQAPGGLSLDLDAPAIFLVWRDEICPD